MDSASLQVFPEVGNFTVPECSLGLWETVLTEGQDLAFLVFKSTPFCLARLAQGVASLLGKEKENTA